MNPNASPVVAVRFTATAYLSLTPKLSPSRPSPPASTVSCIPTAPPCSGPSASPRPPATPSPEPMRRPAHPQHGPRSATTPLASPEPAPASPPRTLPVRLATPIPQRCKMHFSATADAPLTRSRQARPCTVPIGAMYPPTGTGAKTNRLLESRRNGRDFPVSATNLHLPTDAVEIQIPVHVHDAQPDPEISGLETGGAQDPPLVSCLRGYTPIPGYPKPCKPSPGSAGRVIRIIAVVVFHEEHFQ